MDIDIIHVIIFCQMQHKNELGQSTTTPVRAGQGSGDMLLGGDYFELRTQKQNQSHIF